MKFPTVPASCALYLLSLTPGVAELLFPNSDFEGGTLQNWTATGTAFTRQPTAGDNTAARGNVPAGQQGTYWIGTFESYDGVTGAPGDTRGDDSTGTLTSVPFTITKRYVRFLIGGGNHPGLTSVSLVCEGEEHPMATGWNSEAMIPVSFDADAFLGKQATIVIRDQATGSWGHINADDFTGSDEPVSSNFHLLAGIPRAGSPGVGYDQPHRPQFHFTSRRNWLNDPNGMVFDGEKYHLFFQHNPLGTGWGNMTWGHAVSTDMIRWRQLGHALLPYQVQGRAGTIYSGTAVVDHNNTLGLQQTWRPTLAAFYTFASEPYYQAMAHSTDGGVTWTYHDDGREIVPNQGFDAGERDPKVFWHEQSQRWVMCLWVQNNPGRVRFFTSTDLKSWAFASDLLRDWAFECMDVVFLPVDGDTEEMKCVIYDASFDYEVGTFDGTAFQTEVGPFKASHGNFYAAQSFYNAPQGRVVQIGWMNGGPNSATAYGVPFNQQMSFPCELSLRTTPGGVRLCAEPVEEISSLVAATDEFTGRTLDTTNLLTGLAPLDLTDLTLELDPGTAAEIVLELPRTTVRYNRSSGALTFKNASGQTASLVDGPVFPRGGRVTLRLLLDRLSVEAYVHGGEKFGSHYVHPTGGSSLPSLRTTGGQATVHRLVINRLSSAWETETPLATGLVNAGFDAERLHGWTTFGDAEDSVSTGAGAAVLAARPGSGERRAGLYQTLGHVALADVGKTFALGTGFGTLASQSGGSTAGLSVSFRKGVTSGVPGDRGTLLGEQTTVDLVAGADPVPSERRASASFTPALEDVGSEIFVVIDLFDTTPGTVDPALRQSYLADGVTLSVTLPDRPAGLLASEPFDYADASTLSGADGGRGWSSPWVTVNEGSATVAAGSLDPGSRAPAGIAAASTGNRSHLPNGRRVGRTLDTGANGPFAARGLVDAAGRIGKDGGTVYLSFLQQPDGTSLFYEFELHRGDLGDPGRIAGIGNDRSGGDVHLRAPGDTHTLIGPGDSGVNFYVVRIDYREGPDDVRVYRNPVSSTEPGTPTLTRLGAADLSFDGISFGAFVNGRTVAHDEIRIGTSWADVVAGDAFAEWVAQAGLQGPTADFNADADGDSMPNGVEWLLGGDPTEMDPTPILSRETGGEGAWEMIIPLDPEVAGRAELFVEWSTSLEAGSWTALPLGTAAGTFGGGVVLAPGNDHVTARFPAGGPRLFVRLRAERN